MVLSVSPPGLQECSYDIRIDFSVTFPQPQHQTRQLAAMGCIYFCAEIRNERIQQRAALFANYCPILKEIQDQNNLFLTGSNAAIQRLQLDHIPPLALLLAMLTLATTQSMYWRRLPVRQARCSSVLIGQ